MDPIQPHSSPQQSKSRTLTALALTALTVAVVAAVLFAHGGPLQAIGDKISHFGTHTLADFCKNHQLALEIALPGTAAAGILFKKVFGKKAPPLGSKGNPIIMDEIPLPPDDTPPK